MPFEEPDFRRLISWIMNPELLIQFAGNKFKYPLNHSQLLNYISDEKRIPFKVILESETSSIHIGHCELNFEHDVPLLSRILIGDPDFRNKGLGKLIVHAMLKILFYDLNFEIVELNVLEWNVAAKLCYKKLGFVENPQKDKEIILEGNRWKVHNMILSKSNYAFLPPLSSS